MTISTNKWTVVRHSGYGYGGNPQFKGGLESRPVHTQAQVKRVVKAGGVLFDSYTDAEDFAMFAMYYKHSRLIPMADMYGGFPGARLDGLQIYQPTEGIQYAWFQDRGAREDENET